MKHLDTFDRLIAQLARRDEDMAHHVTAAVQAHCDVHNVDALEALAQLVCSGSLRLHAARKYRRSTKGRRAQRRYELRRAHRLAARGDRVRARAQSFRVSK